MYLFSDLVRPAGGPSHAYHINLGSFFAICGRFSRLLPFYLNLFLLFPFSYSHTSIFLSPSHTHTYPFPPLPCSILPRRTFPPSPPRYLLVVSHPRTTFLSHFPRSDGSTGASHLSPLTRHFICHRVATARRPLIFQTSHSPTRPAKPPFLWGLTSNHRTRPRSDIGHLVHPEFR